MMAYFTNIRIQQQDFNLAEEYEILKNSNNSDGALVTFVGLVRDINLGQEVSSLFLEHYPGMTEKSLYNIVEQARLKWDLGSVTIIHRVGQLHVADQIVLVGVTCKHRQSAFHANEFIMDYLKTQAPFWKKERTDTDDKWLDANQSDIEKVKSWE